MNSSNHQGPESEARSLAGTKHSALGIFFSVVGLSVVSLVGLLVAIGMYAFGSFSEQYALPVPEVTITYDLAKAERGRYLFVASCAHCHLSPSDDLRSRRLEELPGSVGIIRVPNLSRDDLYGNPVFNDEQIWAAVQSGIGHGRSRIPIPMPVFSRMHAADIEGIINFLRLDTDIVRAVSRPSQESEYSIVGKVASVLYRSQERMGPKQFRKRGEYLAEAVLNCRLCHSPGTRQVDELHAYTGSDYVYSGSRSFIASPSLRGPKSAMHVYDRAQFSRLLRFGRTPENALVEMPLYPYLAEADIDELYAFFVAERGPENPETAPQRARLASSLDCSYCHRPVPPSDENMRIAHLQDPYARSLYFQIQTPVFAEVDLPIEVPPMATRRDSLSSLTVAEP